ncbi:hypothetical protein [Fluviispira multicolorata]|uniref:Uncharacterized protein n=1 Tax=Fluviispira multicolorata TaxID=2654512 RepID=A0A833JB78_9BACT|nr:hypothetical protein [Fluviispira multicolorata]KAB8027745.1 hypothetical protein GCL57_14135 [Fluviispira multicolorata]
MEDKSRELSAAYYKRKHHLLKKRLFFIFILTFSVLLLLLLSISESWALKILISRSFSSLGVGSVLFFTGLYLLVYNILLSRISLHICYHFENKKIPSFIIMLLFIVVYLIISFNAPEFKNIISLGVSKICIISLYFSFWVSQLSEARLKMRLTKIPSIFLVSWRSFFICKWVLIACWLLSSLGFALALVASHPIIKLEGWEGVILMLTYYFLFSFFVRNPNAHTHN